MDSMVFVCTIKKLCINIMIRTSYTWFSIRRKVLRKNIVFVPEWKLAPLWLRPLRTWDFRLCNYKYIAREYVAYYLILHFHFWFLRTLLMLVLFIYAYSCPIRFLYQMMVVSFSGKTTGVTIGGGTAKTSGTLEFTSVCNRVWRSQQGTKIVTTCTLISWTTQNLLKDVKQTWSELRCPE